MQTNQDKNLVWEENLSNFSDDLEGDVKATADQRFELDDLADDYQTVSLKTIQLRQRPNKSNKDFASSARPSKHPMVKSVEQVSMAQRAAALWVTYNSEDYKEFISGLGNGD